MPLGLGQKPFGGIHQNHRQLRRGGPGYHIARVLDMPGRVGNNKLSLGRGKIAVRDIDGDALLALGSKAIR